jgi:hypothetical protein
MFDPIASDSLSICSTEIEDDFKSLALSTNLIEPSTTVALVNNSSLTYNTTLLTLMWQS